MIPEQQRLLHTLARQLAITLERVAGMGELLPGLPPRGTF